MKIAVLNGVALWRDAVRTVVQFSKQRQARPTPPLQRTLELLNETSVSILFMCFLAGPNVRVFVSCSTSAVNPTHIWGATFRWTSLRRPHRSWRPS
jgi:hypothetical protein